MRRLAIVRSVSVIVTVGLLIVISCGPECVSIMPYSHSEKPTIDAHYIYTASATILALTVFGSVLGIRVVASPIIIKTQNRGLVAIFAGVIALVGIHVHVMISTCCVTWSLTQAIHACTLILTMLFMFLLLLGFAVLVDAQIRMVKETDERKAGVNTDQGEYST